MRKRSLAGLIRERLQDYETRAFYGVQQCVFVEELQKEGYNISLSYFRNLIHFARQKTAQKNAVKEQTEQETKAKPKGFQFTGTGNKEDLI